MLVRTAAAVACLGLLSACGAVFPQYTTATRPPPPGFVDTDRLSPAPPGVRRVTFVGASLPPQRADGREWDDDGPPDLYAVLFRNEVEIYRTPVALDQPRAQWREASVTLYLPPTARVRIELWDDDGAFDDPAGRVEFAGVPAGAALGGEHPLRLQGGAQVRLRIEAPPPLLGMGVTYEVHEEHLRVLEVDAVSPANTAGLRVGDRITAIDGERVASLGEVGARQAMDRNASRSVSLTVVRGADAPRHLDVRVDAVYPAR